MGKINLLTYEQVLNVLPNTKYLLLGNGFSISCDDIFSYTNLYSYAKEHGLTEHVQKVFSHLGTNNFEGVLKLLDDSKWISKHYKLKPAKGSKFSIAKDLASVKKALLSAVAQTHLPYPASVDDERKNKCAKFLEPYKVVFTTNYDLLLYWVSNHALADLKQQDGFRAPIDDPDAPYLVFTEHLGQDKGILFIHGALHLYFEGGEVRKHSWVRSGKTIIDLVKEGLAKNQYPHFVAEGKAHKKLEQIHRSDYMSYCLGKLGRIQSPLVIYGLALNENDYHIANTIAENKDIEKIYIGLYEKPEHASNKAIFRAVEVMQARRTLATKKDRYPKALNVEYYDSKTALIWD